MTAGSEVEVRDDFKPWLVVSQDCTHGAWLLLPATPDITVISSVYASGQDGPVLAVQVQRLRPGTQRIGVTTATTAFTFSVTVSVTQLR